MQFKFCLKNFMVKKQDIIEVKIEAWFQGFIQFNLI
jgi:hypothetical protein